MFGSLKKFFKKPTPEQTGDSGHDARVAACALLMEMAAADDEFSSGEKEVILNILKNDSGLSQEEADALMAEADKELESSLDLWQFTNLINRNYSKDEKISVIETVWRVVYADGVLDKYEDYFVHKLADLLHLKHSELIDAKLKILRGNG